MHTQQLILIKNNNSPKINIILIKNNILILKLITTTGILYKIISSNTLNLLNLKNFLIYKNIINKQNFANIYVSYLIKKKYELFYYKRYYLKLKGLGFSLKYVTMPQHILLFNIGFSKAQFIRIPKIIYIIKKPRKKKNIFTLISSSLNILSKFLILIRKLKTPDPYKIKGLRYIKESIKTKTGKKKK